MDLPTIKHVQADLAVIANWIKEKEHVLDLGCGEGALLQYLQAKKSCTGYGVEIDDEKIPVCVRCGVSVIQHDLEKGLEYFKDDSFDTVLCLSALQMLKNVELLLREIARVGRQAIVSFPNFAYWKHRMALLQGNMPVSSELPFAWYDTPNLRFATISDFESLINQVGLQVIERVAIHEGKVVSAWSNWRGSLIFFRLKKR